MNALIVTVIRLLLAHVVSDFYFQSCKMAENKADGGFFSADLYKHALIVGVLSWLFLFNVTLWWVFPVMFIIHLCVDGIKALFTDSVVLFFADQVVHLVSVILLALFIDQDEVNLIISFNPELYLLGFLVVGRPAAIAVRKVVLSVFGSENFAGMPSAGFTIGIIERCLILVFVLINQYTAIGFRITSYNVCYTKLLRLIGDILRCCGRDSNRHRNIGILYQLGFAWR